MSTLNSLIAHLLLPIFFATPFGPAIAQAQNTQVESKPQYEIYAIRYAVLPDFPLAALIKGADPSRKLDLAMVVWLVRGNGRVILVDSGFYRDQFLKQWKTRDYLEAV